MKRIVAGLVVLLVLVSAFFAAGIRAQQPFVVHEWGTFTTLAGSDGRLLPGLYHEEESLPYFVGSFSGFSPQISKGLYMPCSGATLKMETPVIYFYSDVARSVSVRVDWPAGTISQWYPPRADGEPYPSRFDTLHLEDTAEHGWIAWNAQIRAKAPDDTLGLWKPGETHTWQAPRATDANIVTDSLGNVEKYLFYRGVGNAERMSIATQEIWTQYLHDTLVVANETYMPVPYAFVYQLSDDSATQSVLWAGSLNTGWAAMCPPNARTLNFDSVLAGFRDSLVVCGLYRKEADAMIETWRQSYFGRPGVRVFWIVPRWATNYTLKLDITPTPDSIERVIVARSEILTPAFEHKLDTAFANGNSWMYYGDRYYLAYQARVAAMDAQAARAAVHPVSAQGSDAAIYPNPTTGMLTLDFPYNPISTQVAIIDELGRAQDVSAHAADNTMSLDLSQLQSGVYLLRIQSATGTTMQRVVKARQ
ncbi:MAG: T9SS type A sorting domain-containing protein [Bacteroidota bacterium]|nr:T9SS type A sorting domain-containing protein [Bacteroidota bacterium]MDP4234280.1 T9SS type A sorting domain-containing protein [Bacteroidota bacterium]MDP4243215.1 T9SS type A sorting domain-containing protein [Bacteroidota bacterium]MDP4288079.1 T9SS type A sorting domain-containing protein [Bacteroidota bacterium]